MASPLRRGLGAVTVLLLALALVMGIVLIAQAYLGSAATEQQHRFLDSEEAGSLGESAIAEYIAILARAVNGGADGRDRNPYYQAFRERSGWDANFGFALPTPPLPAFARLLAARSEFRKPAPEIVARVLFQRFFDSTGLAIHDDRFGTLEISATIAYPVRNGTARRRVVHRYEFKTVRPRLPAPFDRTQLYVHAPDRFVNAHAVVAGSSREWSNDLIFLGARTFELVDAEVSHVVGKIQDLIRDLGGKVNDPKAVPTDPEVVQDKALLVQAQAALGQLETTLKAIRDLKKKHDEKGELTKILNKESGDVEPNLWGWPQVLYFFDPTKVVPKIDLAQVNVPGLTRVAIADIKLREEEVARRQKGVQETKDPGQLSTNTKPWCAAQLERVKAHVRMLEAYGAVQRAFVQRRGPADAARFAKWYELLSERTWVNSPVAAGAAAAVTAIAPGKAQFVLAGRTRPVAEELADVMGRYGPPFSGVVYVANAGAPELNLDGTSGPWGAYEGRMLLAVSGDCALKEVKRKDPARDMLTVVCYGKLTIAGRVEASLVPRFQLAHDPAKPVTVLGNLVLDDAVFAGHKDQPPESVLAGITLERDERVPYWTDAAGADAATTAVFVSPVPVLDAAERQVAR